MKAEKAIELRKAVPAHRRRMKEIGRELSALHEESRALGDLLWEGERIRIHRGRPYLGEFDGHYESLNQDLRAQVSKRAVDEYFNVQLDEQRPYGFDSTHYGTKATALKVTEAQAKKIALAWVLDGKESA